MKPQKILFADDDPEIREVLRLLLAGEGYEAVEAARGAEVLSPSASVLVFLLLFAIIGTTLPLSTE